MIFMLLFPLHLAGLHFLRPVLNSLFEVQQTDFDFGITYSGKRIFQIYKSSTILINCLLEIFYRFKFDVQRS